MPLIAVLFAYYLYLGMKDESVVQMPERLHTDRGLVLIVAGLVLALSILAFVDIPFVEMAVQSKFTAVDLGF